MNIDAGCILGVALKLSTVPMHLGDARLCNAFLETAENLYPDLLSTVRTDVAKAMSFWLVSYGYRAQLWWSEKDACFSGRLINVPGGACVEFSGKKPTEVQEAFVKAARDYTERGAAQRKTTTTLAPSENLPLAAE